MGLAYGNLNLDPKKAKNFLSRMEMVTFLSISQGLESSKWNGTIF